MLLSEFSWFDLSNTLIGGIIGFGSSYLILKMTNKKSDEKEKKQELKQLIEKLKVFKIEAALLTDPIKESIGWIRYLEIYKEYNQAQGNHVHNRVEDLTYFQTLKTNMEKFRRYIEYFESEIGENSDWNVMVVIAMDYDFIFHFTLDASTNVYDKSPNAIMKRLEENNAKAFKKIEILYSNLDGICNFMNQYIDDLRKHVKS